MRDHLALSPPEAGGGGGSNLTSDLAAGFFSRRRRDRRKWHFLSPPPFEAGLARAARCVTRPRPPDDRPRARAHLALASCLRHPRPGPPHKRRASTRSPRPNGGGMGGGVAGVVCVALTASDRCARCVCVAGEGSREACAHRHCSRGDTEPVELVPDEEGCHARAFQTFPRRSRRPALRFLSFSSLSRSCTCPASSRCFPSWPHTPAPCRPPPAIISPPRRHLAPKPPLSRVAGAPAEGVPAGAHRHASTRIDTHD